jgi:hypothetical protein
MAAKKRNARETKSLTKNTVPMRPGKNGGQLQTGNPGNKGGGRSPNEIRARLREAMDGHFDTLEKIARGTIPLQTACNKCGWSGESIELPTTASDQLRAIDQLLKYGVGVVKEASVEDVRERVAKTLDVIRRHCPAEQATTIVDALRPVWS